MSDRLIAKWGNEILDAGFTDVPTLVVRNYNRVGMTHAEFGLMMNIFTYKFDSRNPYPSEETLAKNMDCSERQIRKLLKSMTDKKLVIIEKERSPSGKFAINKYNFKPLLDACCQPAEQEVPTEQKVQPAEQEVPKPAEQEVPTSIGTRSSAKKNKSLKEKEKRISEKNKAAVAASHPSSFSKPFKDQKKKPSRTQDPNAVADSYKTAASKQKQQINTGLPYEIFKDDVLGEIQRGMKGEKLKEYIMTSWSSDENKELLLYELSEHIA